MHFFHFIIQLFNRRTEYSSLSIFGTFSVMILLSFSSHFAEAQTIPSCDAPACAPVMLDNHEVTFAGVLYDYPNPGESTWFYCVCSGTSPNISHTVFGEWCPDVNGSDVVDYGYWDANGLNSGGPGSFGNDPTTGVYGLKFDEGIAGNNCINYYFTLNENYAVGDATVAIKAGQNTPESIICGPDPACQTSCQSNFECPNDITIACDVNDLQAEIDDWLEDYVLLDTCCNASITHDYSGQTDCGTYQVNYTVTDDCGFSLNCSANLTIEDNESPVFTAFPGDLSVSCSSIPAIDTPTVTDNCGTPTLVLQETIGSGCTYTIVRTWTATDDCGNVTTQSQTLTISDNTSPVFGAPLCAPAFVATEYPSPADAEAAVRSMYFSAEGRSGNGALNGDFEMDVHRIEAGNPVIEQRDYAWGNGVQVPFTISYDPNATGTDKLVYTLGAGAQQQTINVDTDAEGYPDSVNAILFFGRTDAHDTMRTWWLQEIL